MTKLSVIFEPEPERWGYRGDPWFWRHLKRRSASIDLPVDPQRLEDLIQKEHLRLSGQKLTRNSKACADALKHGGMTSGGIYGRFWIEEAMPLLKKRLMEANKGGEVEDDKTDKNTFAGLDIFMSGHAGLWNG